MAFIQFDVSAFRVAYPLFADTSDYPDATLQGYWNNSLGYISGSTRGRMNVFARTKALNLMTAHIATLSDMQNNGEFTDTGQGIIAKSKIPGMEFTLVPPPVTDSFNWWCALTSYGTQLLALLDAQSVGGFMVPGRIPIGPLR